VIAGEPRPLSAIVLDRLHRGGVDIGAYLDSQAELREHRKRRLAHAHERDYAARLSLDQLHAEFRAGRVKPVYRMAPPDREGRIATRRPRKCQVCGHPGGIKRDPEQLSPHVAGWIEFTCNGCAGRFRRSARYVAPARSAA